MTDYIVFWYTRINFHKMVILLYNKRLCPRTKRGSGSRFGVYRD